MRDEYFMSLALKLAQKGLSWTSPNPMVGAVLVKDGQIIGEGYHRGYGQPHAEIEALNNSKGSAQGSTLYVNLEPCSHHGLTPPCAEAIIEAGVSRVVCAIVDPNPKVSGRGIKRLKSAGIEVMIGPGRQEAERLNEAFIAFHANKRPFIALKFAASLDGKLATRTGDSKWITNEAARRHARSLRGQYQAILVGAETVLADDPNLGTRIRRKKDPVRIILDSSLKLPLSAQVLRDKNVIIATSSKAPSSKKEKLESLGYKLISFNGNSVPLDQLMATLKDQGIISVLVEGGGKVIGSFLDGGLVDKVYAYYAPLLIGGETATTIGGQGVTQVKQAASIKRAELKRFGDNFVISGYLK